MGLYKIGAWLYYKYRLVGLHGMNDSRNISVLLFEQKLIYYTKLPEKKSMVSMTSSNNGWQT